MSCIRIGNQTARAAPDPMTPYHFAITHGFDAFEWFSDSEADRGFAFTLLDADERVRLRDEARAHGIQFSVHAPWEADAWQQQDNALVRQSIAFAADIGADPVVVHLNADAPPHAFVEALLPSAHLARKSGVRLALENTTRVTPAMINALFTGGVIPSPLESTFGLCLDIGHANLCPQTRCDYIGYLDQLAPHVPIIHVHLHENFGDHDSHLTLFTGPAATDDAGVRGVLDRLAGRGYKGSLILEQWPDPAERLVEARGRLATMLEGMSLRH